MPDLTAEVAATMARLNTSIGPDDPPYPASLTPIAEAVIAVVRERVAEVILAGLGQVPSDQSTCEFASEHDCHAAARYTTAHLAAHIARTEKP